ncbi:MAG: glycosyltransferase family 4 protein [bacterium]
MKILLVAGVGERPEAHLFPELVARGIDVDLLCDTTSPYFTPLKEMQFPMTHLKMEARIDRTAIQTIRGFLRTGEYDIVHAFNGRALSNAMLASIGISVLRIGYCGTMGHLHRWDPSAYLAILNPKVDRIVCLSLAVQNYLRSLGLPPCRLVQIYKGHDPSWFSAAPREALRQFGIPDNAMVIGCTANTRPIKGVPVLIEAIRRLAPDFPVHLLLVGHHNDRELKALLGDDVVRNRVHLAGFRMDAPELIGACNCFVMPTLRNEGLSKAVMEAMCMGIPPIVSAVGGMVELVEDGVSGQCVPPGNPDALAKAIRRYATDATLAQVHGENSRNRSRSHFSFETMTDRIIHLYQSLMACKG